MRYLTFLIFAVAFTVVVACAKPESQTAGNTVAAAAATVELSVDPLGRAHAATAMTATANIRNVR